MKPIPGTRLELVWCPDCREQRILHGRTCSRCGHAVQELFDDGATP